MHLLYIINAVFFLIGKNREREPRNFSRDLSLQCVRHTHETSFEWVKLF